MLNYNNWSTPAKILAKAILVAITIIAGLIANGHLKIEI